MSLDQRGRLAETYTLVYAFLASRDHTKAAKAVKKAAKEAQVISIKPGVQPTTETSLENIVYEWKELSARNAELEELKEHLMEELRELRSRNNEKKNSSSDER
ncbi:hypothetical protein CPB86DRAFT_278687 [Serendipita vermifera]|nr:hypothetical protein CPB86DRAFT_278687 [Serendipita vermifera]